MNTVAIAVFITALNLNICSNKLNCRNIADGTAAYRMKGLNFPLIQCFLRIEEEIRLAYL